MTVKLKIRDEVAIIIGAFSIRRFGYINISGYINAVYRDIINDLYNSGKIKEYCKEIVRAATALTYQSGGKLQIPHWVLECMGEEYGKDQAVEDSDVDKAEHQGRDRGVYSREESRVYTASNRQDGAVNDGG